MWARNCPVILPKFRLPRKFRDLLHAANPRHETDGFTSSPKEGMLRIFYFYTMQCKILYLPLLLLCVNYSEIGYGLGAPGGGEQIL